MNKTTIADWCSICICAFLTVGDTRFICVGVVPFRHGERISFSYLVSQKYTGETALVKILRKSEVHEFNVKLETHKRLIPAHIKGRPPSYYIIAGFVFTCISVPYLRSEVSCSYETICTSLFPYYLRV